MSYAVGVDIGGTNVRVALGDDKGKISSRLNEKSEKSSGPFGISRQVIRMIRSLAVSGKILYVGIGSAGPLDLENGSIVNSPHLGFHRIPLVGPLRKELKVPVYLANDCVAAAVAEKEFGHGRGCANFVYVTISSGIGAGVYVDDHLLFGKDGNAHEVGHITVDHLGRLACGCGKRGHWEAYCGGDNISNFVKDLVRSKPRAEIEDSLLHKSTGGISRLSCEGLFSAARKKDLLALEIVEEIGRLNAIGFANITNAYDPELVTVGGAIALANRSLILKPIRRLIPRHCLNRIPRIKSTNLGEDIVLLGALALSRLSKKKQS